MDKLKEVFAKIKEKAKALWANIRKAYAEVKWLKWASLGVAVVLIGSIVACSFTMCGGEDSQGGAYSSGSYSESSSVASSGKNDSESSSSTSTIPKEDQVTADTKGFTYEWVELFPGGEGGYRLTSIGEYNAPKLVLDSTVDGDHGLKPVYQIADGAISGYDTLKIVELPDTIMKIGEQAFAGCSNLYQVTFGQALSEIGTGAFNDCGNLKTAVFRYADGWSVYGNGDSIALEEQEVKDTSNVANLLKNAYCNYFWMLN